MSLSLSKQDIENLTRKIKKLIPKSATVENVKKINDFDSLVYLFSISGTENLVIKIRRRKDIILQEAEMIREMENIPLEKIMYVDGSNEVINQPYFIAKEIEGEELRSLNPDKMTGCIFKDVGSKLGKIHLKEINEKKYPYLERNKKYYTEKKFRNKIHDLKNIIDDSIAKELLNLTFTGKTLIHNDYSPWNVFIFNDKVSCITDFEYSFIGNKVVDLTKTLFYLEWLEMDNFSEEIIEGYKKSQTIPSIFNKKLEYYKLFHSIEFFYALKKRNIKSKIEKCENYIEEKINLL